MRELPLIGRIGQTEETRVIHAFFVHVLLSPLCICYAPHTDSFPLLLPCTQLQGAVPSLGAAARGAEQAQHKQPASCHLFLQQPRRHCNDTMEQQPPHPAPPAAAGGADAAVHTHTKRAKTGDTGGGGEEDGTEAMMVVDGEEMDPPPPDFQAEVAAFLADPATASKPDPPDLAAFMMNPFAFNPKAKILNPEETLGKVDADGNTALIHAIKAGSEKYVVERKGGREGRGKEERGRECRMSIALIVCG